MGEIADMFLDGTLCEQCGVFLDGDSPGYTRLCGSCRVDDRAVQYHKAEENIRKAKPLKTIKCEKCGRRLRAKGLNDHMKDYHNEPFKDKQEG